MKIEFKFLGWQNDMYERRSNNSNWIAKKQNNFASHFSFSAQTYKNTINFQVQRWFTDIGKTNTS